MLIKNVRYCSRVGVFICINDVMMVLLMVAVVMVITCELVGPVGGLSIC